MKNLIIVFFISALLAACSSGTSTGEVPQNVSGNFQGTFQSSNDVENGQVSLSLQQGEESEDVTGNIIFTPNGTTCLLNSTVTGTNTGFNLNLTAPQDSTSGDSGTLNIQLSISGSQLSGTYVSTGETNCSNQTGTGSMNLSR